MIIPKFWICISHEVKLQNGIVWPIRTWGWGETEENARHLAEKRAGQVREAVHDAAAFTALVEQAKKAL